MKLVEIFSTINEAESKRQAKKRYREKMKSETKMIYQGPEGRVLIPLTQEASCFWGRGTKWCTAATRSKNHFEQYNREGPLHVIMPNDNTKWQLHLANMTFKDEKDRSIDIEAFKEKYPWVFTKAITIPKFIQCKSIFWF